MLDFNALGLIPRAGFTLHPDHFDNTADLTETVHYRACCISAYIFNLYLSIFAVDQRSANFSSKGQVSK